MNEFRVLLSFLSSNNLFVKLLPALGEFERLPHPVKLPDAVLMVSSIVVVSQTILVLS
jgi:hypothetical protein